MQNDLRILHVVDGESSGGTLRKLLPDAEILVWRDALYDGPVPGGLALTELSRIRARHWNAKDGNAKDDFLKRDRQLSRANKVDEVVLWFGPTMVCQLSLIQLLDWFSNHRHKNLSLIDWEYAGWLPPDKLGPHLERRRPVSTAMFSVARRAWKAFTAPDTKPLNIFLNASWPELPELRRILVLIAQEYPDSSGLSRIERKLLRQFRRPERAAAAVGNAMVDETFGDTYYFDAVDRFLRAKNQLLCFAEPPRGNLRASRLVVTDFGRKVLAGKADAISFNGINRWVGGVHLEGYNPPRQCDF